MIIPIEESHRSLQAYINKWKHVNCISRLMKLASSYLRQVPLSPTLVLKHHCFNSVNATLYFYFSGTVTAQPVAAVEPCAPVAQTVAHTVPPPPVVAPPPCKPVAPTCPPCKPEAPTCQPCKPAVPTCPPPRPKPAVVAPVLARPTPCVPVVTAQPAIVHPTHVHDVNHPSQPAETWHHHHHHLHAAATAQPVVGTTPMPAVVAHPTTPLLQVDVNAAFPVEAQPAVAPVVVNPPQKPLPTAAPVVAVAAVPPAAGTCCNEGISIC